MDPSKDWGQNEGSRGLEGKETREETGNLSLQEGELPKFSLYLSSLEKTDVPGSGKLTDVDGGEATIKHNRKLIIRLTAKRGELAADANWQLNPGGNRHMQRWAINSNYCWTVESWVNCQRCSWISSFSCFLGTKGT